MRTMHFTFSFLSAEYFSASVGERKQCAAKKIKRDKAMLHDYHHHFNLHAIHLINGRMRIAIWPSVVCACSASACMRDGRTAARWSCDWRTRLAGWASAECIVIPIGRMAEWYTHAQHMIYLSWQCRQRRTSAMLKTPIGGRRALIVIRLCASDRRRF